MEEELQLYLEDGEEIIERISPESYVEATYEATCDTPTTPAQKTPRRSLKRKREEDESEVQKKFLDIAQTQADSMKMLAESFTRLVEAQVSFGNRLQAFGEGMTVCAEAINNLARALGPQ
ncbi:uncharacterized protein LOC118745806 [Rhagoletis pomonella]|uniref:uncharacterized protein LOC118745806 n=1 Tax=Rhagoletis pomonella TaxID=28610 RepID=UPI00177AF35A|nr:uncharacterized protein LOC118745806 [Rhagoletis pomonella]